MTKEFVLDILEVCSKHGYITDIIIRNIKIEEEYQQLRKEGKTGKESRFLLSDKYCTSIKTIESILYGKKKNDN